MDAYKRVWIRCLSEKCFKRDFINMFAEGRPWSLRESGRVWKLYFAVWRCLQRVKKQDIWETSSSIVSITRMVNDKLDNTTSHIFPFFSAAQQHFLTLTILSYYCHTDYLLLLVRIMPERSSFRAYTAILYLDPRMKIYIQVRKPITCSLAFSVNSAPSRLSFFCHRTKRCRPSDWQLACTNPSKWLVNSCCTF